MTIRSRAVRVCAVLIFSASQLTACGGGGSGTGAVSGGGSTQPSGISTPSQVNVVTPSN